MPRPPFPYRREYSLTRRHLFYENLQKEAKALASAQGIAVEGVIVEGDEIQSLTDDLESWQADLLVIGRRHHSSLTARIVGSTTQDVAEKTRCSIPSWLCFRSNGKNYRRFFGCAVRKMRERLRSG